MPADLKPRPVPAGVPVGGPFHEAILDIIGSLGCADIHLKQCLQQTVVLMPVSLRDKINPAVIGINNHILLYFRCAVTVNKTDYHTQRPVLHAADITCRNILMLLCIVNVNIPGIIVHRLIFIDTQYIALSF
mgnify:CR=1 FL=1